MSTNSTPTPILTVDTLILEWVDHADRAVQLDDVAMTQLDVTRSLNPGHSDEINELTATSQRRNREMQDALYGLMGWLDVSCMASLNMSNVRWRIGEIAMTPGVSGFAKRNGPRY